MWRLVVAELVFHVDAIDRVVDAILDVPEIAHGLFPARQYIGSALGERLETETPESVKR